MARQWTREFLSRRIDRCYRIAAWTRIAEKRAWYVALARHYRALLGLQGLPPSAPLPG